MPEGKTMNRWWVVLGAVLIQLCLGAIYAWSVFTLRLKDPDGPYQFTATQTQIIFSVGLATFALVMIFAGRMLATVPPRRIVAVGGLTLGVGYIAASQVGGSFVGILLTIGVIGGAGIGLGYVVPIAVGLKWFPDKKGMLTGLAVAGFGFGASLWVKLAGAWGNLIADYGLANVFLYYGVAFAVVVSIGSIWMVNPPDGYCPKGWSPPQPSDKDLVSAAADVDSGAMLRMPKFYTLWGMFVAGSMAGLMVIGCIAMFGIDALKSGSMDHNAAKAAAGTAMAVFAIANGLGRIGWGMISDKLGRRASLGLMFLIQGIVMLLFYPMGFNVLLLCVAAAIVGFNFGGNFALFPAATADFFGNKNVGANYAWVFTAYGVGGIIGPLLAGIFKDSAPGDTQAWLTPFVIAGIACLAAAGASLLLRPQSSST